MKKFGAILLSVIFSCTQNENKDMPEVYLYYRNIGGNNGYITYSDYVVIDNYKNNFFTIKQLCAIAKKYIDTVKADKPISGVAFIGKAHNKSLPDIGWDNYTEQKKYLIVDFGFDNSLKQFSMKIKPDIDIISIWKNGQPTTYLSKKSIDSLLSLQEAFSND